MLQSEVSSCRFSLNAASARACYVQERIASAKHSGGIVRTSKLEAKVPAGSKLFLKSLSCLKDVSHDLPVSRIHSATDSNTLARTAVLEVVLLKMLACAQRGHDEAYPLCTFPRHRAQDLVGICHSCASNDSEGNQRHEFAVSVNFHMHVIQGL